MGKTFRIKAIETATAAYQSATKGLLPTIQRPLEKTRRRASITLFSDLFGSLPTADSLLTVRRAVITMHRRDPHSSEEPSAAGERAANCHLGGKGGQNQVKRVGSILK